MLKGIGVVLFFALLGGAIISSETVASIATTVVVGMLMLYAGLIFVVMISDTIKGD